MAKENAKTKNNYVLVKLYHNTGKISVDSIRQGNFHPKSVNKLFYRLGGDDYLFCICPSEKADSVKQRLVKNQLDEVTKELKVLTSKEAKYKKILNKLKNGENKGW